MTTASLTKQTQTVAKDFIDFVRQIYQTESIDLHAPSIDEQDINAVQRVMSSGMISTIGAETEKFEAAIADYFPGCQVFATNSGTSALHLSLLAVGVTPNSLVITQPVSFVATCNAIAYCGASPCFVDVDETALALDVDKLETFLDTETELVGGECIHRETGKIISACVPVHIFGQAKGIEKVVALCKRFHIPLVEDAAEALGSSYKGKPLGQYGQVSTISFNGNKIISTGAGGAVISADAKCLARIRHLGCTAKQIRHFDIDHDAIGYNYRMPALNAALGRSQLAKLPQVVGCKRRLAKAYRDFFSKYQLQTLKEGPDSYANYWLNAVVFSSLSERNAFLEVTQAAGIGTRPLWRPLSLNPIFKEKVIASHDVARMMHDKVVCLPSSAPPAWLAE